MNFENYANSKMYSFFDIVYKLMLINVIWFFLSLIGLGILTIFPALITSFILINTLMEQSEFPIVRGFRKTFVKEYLKSQKIFAILFLIALVLFFNMRIYYLQLAAQESFVYNIGFWITLVLILVYLMMVTHVFMIYLFFPHFKTFQTLKYAFLFSLAFPFRTLFLLIIYIGVMLGLVYYPTFFPLVFLLVMSVLVFFTIKVLRPKYIMVLKDKKPLNVYDYIQ